MSRWSPGSATTSTFSTSARSSPKGKPPTSRATRKWWPPTWGPTREPARGGGTARRLRAAPRAPRGELRGGRGNYHGAPGAERRGEDDDRQHHRRPALSLERSHPLRRPRHRRQG